MLEKKTVDVNVSLEYKDFLRNIFWQTLKKVWFVFLLALLLTPLLIYFIILMVIAGKFSATAFLPSLPLFAALFALYGVHSSANRSFEAVKGQIQWSFSDEGYETFTPLGTSKSNWESLDEVRETNSDFLLFIQKPIFTIIPKRCFQNDLEIKEFREIVKRHIGNKAKLKND